VSTVVFVGPTLPRALVQDVLPAAQLEGPAGCGDIYRAVRDGASTVVLIDGYFDQRLSVWHKELLFALSRGARAYGAASMGALRAAELSRFGMIGVGRIFDWYLTGVIEADDEVAIVHESAERGFRPVSEAMVNLRATFLYAESAGVIGAATCAKLIELGRSIFYPSRTFRAVLSQAAEQGVSSAELSRLRDWLGARPGNVVDQKRADALALLERVRVDSLERVAPEKPGFDFEYTEVWHELTRQVRDDTAPLPNREGTTAEPDGASIDDWTTQVMHVLKTSKPSLAANLLIEAERRAALLQCASLSGLEASASEVQAASDELRYERSLLSPASTERWLDERGLDITELSTWMRDEVLLARARQAATPRVHRQLRRILHASRDPAVLSAIAHAADCMTSRDIHETETYGQ
jgi:hypothetical protein